MTAQFFTSPPVRVRQAAAGQDGRYCYAAGVTSTLWYFDLKKSAKPEVFRHGVVLV